MSYQSIILLIIATINLCLAVAVYLRNRQSPANFYYSMMVFVGSLWILGLFGYSMTFDNPTLRLFFTQLTYIFTLITGLYYFVFTYHFPYKTFTIPKIFFIFLYIFISLYALILSLDPGYLLDLSILYTNLESLNLINYLTFSLIFSIIIISGFIILFRKLNRAEGVIRRQIKYVLIATFLTYLLASITNLATGFFYQAEANGFLNSAWSDIYWLGPVFSLINVTVIGWILFKK